MTQLTEHAKTILRAIADGKQVQRYTGIWGAAGIVDAACMIEGGEDDHLRIKPEVRSINGVELAAPAETPGPCKGHLSINSKVYRFIKVEDADSWAIAICDVLEGKSK